MLTKKSLALCLLSMILFPACAETPENVKEKVDILAENKADGSQNNEIEYCSLSEIRSCLDNDIKSNKTTIKVDNARVGTGTEMPVYDVKAKLATNEGFKELCSFVFNGEYDCNNSDIYEKTNKGDAMDKNYPAYEYPYDYSNDGLINNANAYWFDIFSCYPDKKNNETIAAFLYGTGVCWGTNKGLSEEYYFESLETKSIYHPLYEKIPNDIAFTMKDGTEWNLQEAVDYAENFYNTYLTQFDGSGNKYLVQTVIVQRFEDDTYGYLFEFAMTDKNGNYYESEPFYPKPESYYDKVFSDVPFPVEFNSYLWCYDKKEINRFHKDCSLDYQKKIDDGNKLLTLGSAINLLNNKLADKKALKIDCAELNYVLYCKDYDIWKKWYNGNWYDYCKEHGFDFLNDKDCRSGAYSNYNALVDCELQIRPTWIFKTSDTNLLDLNTGETYYVDAVTSEIQVIR